MKKLAPPERTIVTQSRSGKKLRRTARTWFFVSAASERPDSGFRASSRYSLLNKVRCANTPHRKHGQSCRPERLALRTSLWHASLGWPKKGPIRNQPKQGRSARVRGGGLIPPRWEPSDALDGIPFNTVVSYLADMRTPFRSRRTPKSRTTQRKFGKNWENSTPVSSSSGAL